ncbi:MAG TPA: hypothetical protein VGK89_12665 [Candidatus Eisenbacteria bacterium]|jgi:hypothetical protein
MRRLAAVVWAGVVVTAWIFAAAVPAAAQCWACYTGCTPAGQGYLYCTAGSVGGVPYCAVGGACSNPGGDGNDIPPKLRRPILAAAASPLRVYELLFRCPRSGRRFFETEETSRVLPGAARPFGVPAVLDALKQLSPGAAGRLAVAAGLVSVGPGFIDGAYLGVDGSGFGMRLAAEGAGVRMSLCSVRNEAPGGLLAEAVLAAGDLLVVQVVIGGESFVCVLSPTPVGSGAATAEDEAAGLRSAFLDQVDSAWRVHRDPGLSLEFVPLIGSCP